MGVHRYFTLIASLPPLPFFEQAKRLPISPERLQGRLRLLADGDRTLVKRLAAFLRWQRQTRDRSDEVIVRDYQDLRRQIDGTACVPLVEGAVTQRTLVVALRRRQRGWPAPGVDEPWGVGPWVGTLRRRWDQPEFGLGAVFPWLARARELLAAGQALELERLLTRVAWERLLRAQPLDPFRFESLLVYLLRWDVLEQWLSQAPEAAQPRFDELVTEAIGDYEQQFH